MSNQNENIQMNDNIGVKTSENPSGPTGLGEVAAAAGEYKYGFTTDVEMESFGKGLSEDVIRAISLKKNEPPFLLEFRLKAYRKWLTMKEPNWAHVQYPAINYQDILYFAAPKQKPKLTDLDEVDPEMLAMFTIAPPPVCCIAG